MTDFKHDAFPPVVVTNSFGTNPIIALRPIGKDEYEAIVFLGLRNLHPYVVWHVGCPDGQEWVTVSGRYTDNLATAWRWWTGEEPS